MKKPKHKTIYLLDPKLKWKTFKLLQDKLAPLEGVVPVHFDKIVWQLMKDRRIYCWFDPNVKRDMKMGLELPKNVEISLLTNPK